MIFHISECEVGACIYWYMHAWDRKNGGRRCWKLKEREESESVGNQTQKEYSVGLADNFPYIFAPLAKQYF